MFPETKIRAVVASPRNTHVVSIRDIKLRRPFSNEALVRVKAFSMNRGELNRAKNTTESKMQIGWDIAGVVEMAAVDGSGPGVGTRVVGFSTRMEGWAELVSIPAKYLAPIPENITEAEAATLPVAGLTALHSIDAASGLIGRKALITGATGGVGMFATQLAIVGGATVFAQIRNKKQIPFVESLGPCKPILSTNGEGIENWGPYRLVVDGISGVILESGIRSLSPDGICVCYGITSAPTISVDVRPFMFSGEAKMMGFYLYSQAEKSPPSEGLSRLLQLVSEQKITCMIEKEASWDDVGIIAEELFNRTFNGKAVLHIE